jgi:hypothetical protein
VHYDRIEEEFEKSKRSRDFSTSEITYNILLSETTFLKFQNLLKMVSHLLLTV